MYVPAVDRPARETDVVVVSAIKALEGKVGEIAASQTKAVEVAYNRWFSIAIDVEHATSSLEDLREDSRAIHGRLNSIQMSLNRLGVSTRGDQGGRSGRGDRGGRGSRGGRGVRGTGGSFYPFVE